VHLVDRPRELEVQSRLQHTLSGHLVAEPLQ
jgi:hypothetical protein